MPDSQAWGEPLELEDELLDDEDELLDEDEELLAADDELLDEEEEPPFCEPVPPQAVRSHAMSANRIFLFIFSPYRSATGQPAVVILPVITRFYGRLFANPQNPPQFHETQKNKVFDFS